MFSTLLELAGFGAIIAATALVAGLAGALFVAGPVLLVIGYATDDEKATVALSRVVLRLAAVTGRVRGRVRRRAVAKAG